LKNRFVRAKYLQLLQQLLIFEQDINLEKIFYVSIEKLLNFLSLRI